MTFWLTLLHKTGYGFGFGTGMGFSYLIFQRNQFVNRIK